MKKCWQLQTASYAWSWSQIILPLVVGAARCLLLIALGRAVLVYLTSSLYMQSLNNCIFYIVSKNEREKLMFLGFVYFHRWGWIDCWCCTMYMYRGYIWRKHLIDFDGNKLSCLSTWVTMYFFSSMNIKDTCMQATGAWKIFLGWSL